MKSRSHELDEALVELFKVELTRIVDAGHEMVRLADSIDWANFEQNFGAMWDDKGRPAHRYPADGFTALPQMEAEYLRYGSLVGLSFLWRLSIGWYFPKTFKCCS